MLTWVIYDIASDRIRNKVSKKCKNVGLYRVQKVSFLVIWRITDLMS